EEINYRRFFDITDLVSLRMELFPVFAATHQLVFRLLREGKITGLRIDHPDGLWDPKQYCQRLQAGFGQLITDSGQAAASSPTPLYVVVEKILTGDEPLPPDWPVAGTTGYDFLNRLNGLFVNGVNAGAFDQLYEEFTGCPPEFEALVNRSKKLILHTSLISELRALTHRLKSLAVSTRYGQDFTFNQLHTALFEIIAAFPVYRTYVTAETTEVSPTDRGYILQAVRAAKDWNGAMDKAVLEFIQNLLLLQPPDDLDATEQARCRDFVLRFQQLTGPVMAKGLEDTAFYNFNRFISLNEVGGDPGKFGVSLEEFHAYNTAKARHWPHSLLATATHDTKRGEDLRARLNVLSELPAQWRQAVMRWRDWNAEKKGLVDGQPAPHPNDEYLLYQTLVGAWLPEAASEEGLKSFQERIGAYLLKALKEAKARTTWTKPNTAYEEATQRFVAALLSPARPNPFLEDLIEFQHQAAFFGVLNSLSQTLLKLTAPGVPDFYQGTELWDFNLVDPDNRRPVNYALHRQLLGDLKGRWHGQASNRSQALSDLLQHSHTGQVKLFLIWCALTFRHLHRDLFEQGAYVPLLATGSKKEHLCAFAREWQGQSAVVVVPRLILGLTQGAERLPLGQEVWQDTVVPLPNGLPNQQYRNVLTEEVVSATAGPGGSVVPAREALATFPVALLQRL
ncbi:MAG TPA: malto-oligosyltrehalose synthase, partial [Candidatus Sulfotelmatobacter sp.]|nr:malto-oligosyltrehalose synthase [Candidatus Sulfotelmatobacter sp.]